MAFWQLCGFAALCGVSAAAATRVVDRIARFIHWWRYGQ
jgi:hypothetical protein